MPKKKAPPSAPRNFVAKHSQQKSGAGAHVPKELRKKQKQKDKMAMKKEARNSEPLFFCVLEFIHQTQRSGGICILSA